MFFSSPHSTASLSLTPRSPGLKTLLKDSREGLLYHALGKGWDPEWDVEGNVKAFNAQLRKILVIHQKRPEGSWAKVVWGVLKEGIRDGRRELSVSSKEC